MSSLVLQDRAAGTVSQSVLQVPNATKLDALFDGEVPRGQLSRLLLNAQDEFRYRDYLRGRGVPVFVFVFKGPAKVRPRMVKDWRASPRVKKVLHAFGQWSRAWTMLRQAGLLVGLGVSISQADAAFLKAQQHFLYDRPCLQHRQVLADAKQMQDWIAGAMESLMTRGSQPLGGRTKFVPLEECNPPYEKLKPLGRGLYGAVFLVKRDDKFFALKEFHSCFAFRAEIVALAQLGEQSFVPTLYDSFVCLRGLRNTYSFVMEKLDGTLLDFVKEHIGDTDVPASQLDALLGMLQGAEEVMRSIGMNNTDIHPGNVMFKDEGRIWKLIDFGLATTSRTFTAYHSLQFVFASTDWTALLPFVYNLRCRWTASKARWPAIRAVTHRDPAAFSSYEWWMRETRQSEDYRRWIAKFPGLR